MMWARLSSSRSGLRGRRRVRRYMRTLALELGVVFEVFVSRPGCAFRAAADASGVRSVDFGMDKRVAEKDCVSFGTRVVGAAATAANCGIRPRCSRRARSPARCSFDPARRPTAAGIFSRVIPKHTMFEPPGGYWGPQGYMYSTIYYNPLHVFINLYGCPLAFHHNPTIVFDHSSTLFPHILSFH